MASVTRTHEGVIVEIGRYSREAAETAATRAVAQYALVGPLTLLFLGLPGAMLVEHLGWWLVNEQVLAWRWLTIGVPVWAAMFAIGWITWSAPPRQRLEITAGWLGVTHRRLGLTTWRARIPMQRITSASVRDTALGERVRVVHADGKLDVLVSGSPMSAATLARLITDCALAAREADAHGRATEVPPALVRLLRPTERSTAR